MLTRDRDKRRRGRGRVGVFALNQGSSPFGVRSVLPLNQPGGGFGSGRTAGGGAGAGATLAQALVTPAASVQGPISDVGPPPVTPSPAPQQEEHPFQYQAPTFSPRPVDTRSLYAALFPTFSPVKYPKFTPY